MNQPAKKLDRHAVQWQTSMNNSHVRDYLKRARDLENDYDRAARLKLLLCPVCHYLGSGIGGAAMTTRPCAICNNDVLYGSTCTDVLCDKCAKLHDLCKHCGADRELRRNRRKFGWIPPAAPLPPTDSSGETVRMVMASPMILLPRRN